MGWTAFYREWLKRALVRAPGVTDGIISLSGLVVAVAVGLWPALGVAVSAVWWQVILWTFAAVTAARLILAPYWIWRDSQGVISDNAGLVASQKDEIARLESAIAEARKPKPPPPDYDGIYQRGIRVGRADGIDRRVKDGVVHIQLLEGDPDFNEAQPFNYQDLSLIVRRSGMKQLTGAGVNRYRTSLQSVICEVVGPAK